jgi:hypothetical protein
MQKTVVKYLMIVFTLAVYLNRGIYITPYEAKNYGNEETNSVLELIIQLITGESNDIDEDGDEQTDCSSGNIVNYNFYQEFAQYLDYLSLHSKNLMKLAFPIRENILQKGFHSPIEHPPEEIA